MDLTVNKGNNHSIADWLTAYRLSGFSVGKARLIDVENSMLRMYQEDLIAQDLAFIDNMPVRLLWEGDADYPARIWKHLGEKRPRVFFCMGDTTLLNKPSICICGARDASDESCEIAFNCGKLLAQAGYVVISGYARGIDIAAHMGALEGNGSTAALLPYGLSRFTVRRGLHEKFDPDIFLVASELPPVCGFMIKTALRRNTLMVSITEAVIVIEPGDTGGTWYTAERAQEMKKPFFFCEGSRPDSIDRMESLGAARLTIGNGMPVLDEVYERCKR